MTARKGGGGPPDAPAAPSGATSRAAAAGFPDFAGGRVPQRYDDDADLTALLDHPRNPRRGDDAVVGESITANGFYGAVIAQQSTGHILAGHTRRRALLKDGQDRGPVLWLDVDDATAERILLADNRTAELASWDDEALLSLLEDHADALDGTGYTADTLAALATDMSTVPEPLPDEPERGTRRARMLKAYEENVMRQLVFVYPRDEYDAIVRQLESLRRARGADSYAAVVASLVAAAGESPGAA